MAKMAGKLPLGLMVGLGGSLDVFAGTVKRAPVAWQKLDLEWLYRLIKEPRRIGRMMKLPLFVLEAAGEIAGEYGDLLGEDVTSEDIIEANGGTDGALDRIDAALDAIAQQPADLQDELFGGVRDELLDKKKDIIEEALREYYEELTESPSEELAGVLDEYLEQIGSVDTAGGAAADAEASEALDDLLDEAKAALDMQQKKDEAKAEYAEAFEAANGRTAGRRRRRKRPKSTRRSTLRATLRG